MLVQLPVPSLVLQVSSQVSPEAGASSVEAAQDEAVSKSTEAKRRSIGQDQVNGTVRQDSL